MLKQEIKNMQIDFRWVFTGDSEQREDDRKYKNF